MRCSCKNCGVYMIQSDDGHLGCVCPECGARCRDCLGTNSVISAEFFEKLRTDPAMAELFMKRLGDDGDDGEDG